MTAKDFKLLGKLVYSKSPAASRQLLAAVKHLQQERTDYHQIPFYYKKFCQYKGLEADFPSIGWSHDNVKSLRIFFSAMIHIYIPSLLVMKKCGNLPAGFINALHRVSGKNKGNISKDINIILFRERVYDEYKQEVADLLFFLQKDSES